MKTTILLIALILVTNAARAASETAKQGDALATQVSVTRDALQQVMTKLRNGPSSQVGSNPDFIAKAEEFNAQVEAGMTKFEERLKSKVLKQAEFYIRQLNSINDSAAYTREQKAMLIRDRISVAKTVFADLSKEYQAAIKDLYTLELPALPPYSLSLYRELDGKVRCSDNRPNLYVTVQITSPDRRIDGMVMRAYDYQDKTGIYSPCSSGSLGASYQLKDTSYYDLTEMKPIRDDIFNQAVRKGCFTASCVVLFSSHRLGYLSLVAAEIDKNITFTVAGQSLTLESYRGQMPSLTMYRDFITVQEGETKELPFEISEAEFAELKRKAKIDELKYLLLNPPGHIFGGWSCPAEQVNKLKDELRLSSSEISELEKAIDNADVYKKAARKECLGR